MEGDEISTPTTLKRAHAPSEHDAPTPTPIKRRRLEDTNGGSPSTPKALNAIASALGGAHANRMPTFGVVNGVPILPFSAKPRPAIKLAALRGTIWDTGETKRSTIPKKPTTPKKAIPKKVTPRKATPSRPLPVKQPTPEGSPTVHSPQKTNGAAASASASASATEESEDENAPETPSARKVPFNKRPFSSVAVPLPPKGILTPSKKRGPKPRKNVTFNGSSGEVFFEDIPKDATPKAITPKKPRAPWGSKKIKEVAEDEIRCEICSKPNSKPPNEIILCDNCDFAVHQLCYEVPEIPAGDWLCKTCTQEDILKLPNKPDVEMTDAPSTVTVEVPDIPNLDRHLRALQRVMLDRCAGRRRIHISGQQEAYDKARGLLEQTVLAGEGNSMLLIGARGSGKTTMVENIIFDLSQEHRQDFHVVRLNGFIHTDDKVALKEIWRQLGKEMDVEDDLVNRTNHADTMASLLALLSHPSEIMGTDEGVTSQSVIFVIDEFDMFAAHPRQTLLYNLFDIAQSRKAPIAVLGCTSRLDVVEMLEKRVKSRFSHRYVYLSLPRTPLAFWHICRQGLMVEEADAGKEGIDTQLEGYQEFQNYWVRKIEELYKRRSFQDLLQYHYYTTKSAASFFTEWILPLSSVSASDLTLKVPSAGSELTSLAPPDSRMHLLTTLSELDLGILIAAARLDIVAHTDTVNFAMAYDEYSSLVGKQRVQVATAGMLAVGGGARVWSRGVGGIAWERLITLGLLVPAGIGGGKASGHSGLDSKMWKVDVRLEEIPGAVKLNPVLTKWCKEI